MEKQLELTKQQPIEQNKVKDAENNGEKMLVEIEKIDDFDQVDLDFLYSDENPEGREYLKKIRKREFEYSVCNIYGNLGGERTVLGAKKDSRIVGMLQVLIEKIMTNPLTMRLSEQKTGEAIIHAFQVAPEFRNQGIGSKLLEAAEDLAKAEEIKTLKIDVEENSIEALKLYLDKGFKECGRGEKNQRKGVQYVFLRKEL